MQDMSCLAEGYVVPADFESTGINLNEIIVGSTGCGKSMSNAYSRLVHTWNSSVVVPLTKRDIQLRFARMFEQRGYDVITLDFANPSACKAGYDPMDYIHSDEDVIQTARTLVESGPNHKASSSEDPYWTNSATSVLAAEIALVRLNAKSAGKKPCFADVIELHRSMKVDDSQNTFKSNLDMLFEAAEERYPDSQAPELWKTIKNLSSKTASCILSFVNNALDKIFSENVIAMMKKRKKISFKTLGEKKTALFIITSPMNKALQNLVTMMYADMFRELFESAEKNVGGRLENPVHFICDDFACGSRICDFEEYISIFRAAGISVTLLLQSESQLISMYGDYAATTIINNCDTYIYMGGTDTATVENISKKLNKPFETVFSLPLEQVVVLRRGSKPVVGKRYQTLEDPEYKKAMEENGRLHEKEIAS